MKKTFLERLETKQIDNFLKSVFPNYTCSLCRFERVIHVNVNSEDFCFNLTLLEFSSINCKEDLWLKYLYSIFGEEYKDAYLAHCAEVFN